MSLPFIETLQKLISHEKSARLIGSIAEAEAFSAKIQNLLLAHKLTMSEVEFTEQENLEPIEQQIVSGEDLGLSSTFQRQHWQLILASGVARNFFCRLLSPHKSSAVLFVGRKSDREMAIGMYKYLMQLARDISVKEQQLYKSSGGLERAYKASRSDLRNTLSRRFRTSFLLGFALAISRRMRTTRAEVEAQPSNASSMVLISKQEDALDQWIKDQMSEGKVEDNLSKRNLRPEQSAFNLGLSMGSEVSIKSRNALA